MGTRTHQQIIAAWDAAAGQMSAFGEEGADRDAHVPSFVALHARRPETP